MSGRGAPSPREWVGEAPFPWPPAHALREGDTLRGCYCVVDLSLARTRQDQAYLRLTLTDRNGTVEARLWENAIEAAAGYRAGAYIGVEARVEVWNGAVQLCLEALAPVAVQLEDLELFLPHSRRSDAEMDAELRAAIDSVRDEAFRPLLDALLGPGTEVGRAFRLAPAAKQNHHAFLGGLLEHTLSVARVCDLLAAHYGPVVDRDLLVTAALLHDVGKVREIGARAGFPYTDEGKLLGHILLGLQMVHDAAGTVPGLLPGRLLLLEHLIAAHQGRYEWQSPREPSILEGLLLHYADDLDAKLQQVTELMSRGSGPWTGYDRSFRRDFLRHLETVPPPPLPDPPAPAIEPAATPPVSPGEPHAEQPTEAEAAAAARRRPARKAERAEAADVAPVDESRILPPAGFPRLSDDTLDLFGEAP